jgi:uncharacterized membrane protein
VDDERQPMNSGDEAVEHDERSRGKLSPERVLTLTDGVFAIIITILVLDLEVPDLSPGVKLADALEEVRPTFVAFVISFLIVGMYWVWHRGVFANVRYVDLNLIWINLLFLLPVSMVPFVASVLGEYSSDPAALRLYGLVLIVATLIRTWIDLYLDSHPGLLWTVANKQQRRVSRIAAASPMVVYIVAMLLADVAPGLSLFLFFAMPGIYFALVTFLDTGSRTEAASEDPS